MLKVVAKYCKAVLVSLILLATPAILLALFLIFTSNSTIFDEQEVITTCEVLSLPPEVEFCSQPAAQDVKSLEATLNQVYPVETTDLAQLNNSFSVQLRYATESCNGLRTLPNNAFPAEGQCENGFGYFASLPIFSARLWIRFDEDTRVTGYSVAYDPS